MGQLDLKNLVEFDSGGLAVRSQAIFFLAAQAVGAVTIKEFFVRFLNANTKKLTYKGLNVLLLIIMITLGFYLVYDTASAYKKASKLDLQEMLSEGQSQADQERQILKDYASYESKLKDRNIFKMGKKPSPEEIPDVISAKAAQATQSLKLVGISWSDNPDAIIEDTKTLKTFFVKKGQPIGELKVENIYKDKVVLSFGQERVELR